MFIYHLKVHIRNAQAKKTSRWQSNAAISDNLHSYSSSVAASISEDPNSCQITKWSLQCFLCCVFKHEVCNASSLSSSDFSAVLPCEVTADCKCLVSRVHQNSCVIPVYVLKLCYISSLTQGAILAANSGEGKWCRYGDQTEDRNEHTLRQASTWCV